MITNLASILSGLIALIGGAILAGEVPTTTGTVAIAVFFGLVAAIPQLVRELRR